MAGSLPDVASTAEPEPPTDTQKSPPLPALPPLPDRLLALPPLVYAGTILWFVASCVLLILQYGYHLSPPIWLWTTLAGTALGFVGMLVMWWQRTASRRGSRSAQRDL
ncbi:MAG: DUF2530 domain-containing protein [Labedaea sp.]